MRLLKLHFVEKGFTDSCLLVIISQLFLLKKILDELYANYVAMKEGEHFDQKGTE